MLDVKSAISKFYSVFEPALLAELETKSMLMSIKAGETVLNPGQNIRAIPLMLSGTFKVSRVNGEGLLIAAAIGICPSQIALSKLLRIK